MGIQGLTKLIGDAVPKAIRNGEIKQYFGRKVAIDASMCLYQFLVAVRSEGNMLVNAEGESTSHLMGMFYRTIRMMENGIKPVYVFEGKAPTMKGGELEKRRERREEAAAELSKAQEEENQEAIEKFSKRLVKVTPQHNEDCKELLKLMGVPFVNAPGEAEAQCAALAKAGKVFAVGTEDMDALTFGAPVLLRQLTMSESRKLPIREFRLSDILEGLDLDMDSFIDLCILLGCDYCESIKGIGPKKAIEVIGKHKNLAKIIDAIDKNKFQVPENWPFEAARKLFKDPLIQDPNEIELKWQEVDEEGVVKYLCERHGFNEERIRLGIKKLQKAKTSTTQGRIDSFFNVLPTEKKSTPQKAAPAKTTGSAKRPSASAGKGRPSKKRPK